MPRLLRSRYRHRRVYARGTLAYASVRSHGLCVAAIYRDRRDAGEKLASAVAHLEGAPRLLVFGLPRGGVPVAEPVARRLAAPLDVFVVRKICYPGHEELAMGAVASGGVAIVERGIAEHVPEDAFQAALGRALRELDERERRYRGSRPREAQGLGRPRDAERVGGCRLREGRLRAAHISAWRNDT